MFDISIVSHVRQMYAICIHSSTSILRSFSGVPSKVSPFFPQRYSKEDHSHSSPLPDITWSKRNTILVRVHTLVDALRTELQVQWPEQLRYMQTPKRSCTSLKSSTNYQKKTLLREKRFKKQGIFLKKQILK